MSAPHTPKPPNSTPIPSSLHPTLPSTPSSISSLPTPLSHSFLLPYLTHPGYFTSPILPDSTWTQTVNFINSTESETWTQPFCRMIDHIDQEPNAVVSPLEVERRGVGDGGIESGGLKDKRNDKGCPPNKGWATVWMEGYVWSMFVVPVSYSISSLFYRLPTIPKSFCAHL